MNYYVYYKLDPAQVAALRPAVQHLFGVIEAQCGVRGRWMRRRDDPSTYMEVYEGVEDEALFERVLAEESAHMPVERSIERFLSCA